jgi:hypothetical protein
MTATKDEKPAHPLADIPSIYGFRVTRPHQLVVAPDMPADVRVLHLAMTKTAALDLLRQLAEVVAMLPNDGTVMSTVQIPGLLMPDGPSLRAPLAFKVPE